MAGLDKGISGQNTTQMLSRFQKDVIDLNPQVVVIMGGTNDLAQGVTKEQIVANLSAMAEMADEVGIRVVLCSVTPCNDSYSKLNDPKTKGAHIITLNGMIQSLASSKGFTWCDYWTHLVAEDGLALKEEYRLYDNLHPSSLFFLFSCVKEGNDVQPTFRDGVTIRVTIPEDLYTKVAFTPEDNKLDISWQEGDVIRIISNQDSQVYTLTKLISAHEAEFSGSAVAGSSFDILCPGTYASVEEAEADTATPAQTGNGSTEHLRFRALLSGVDQYTDIAFTSSWASSHGGTLKQGAAVKIVAGLPDGVTTLKSVGSVPHRQRQAVG